MFNIKYLQRINWWIAYSLSLIVLISEVIATPQRLPPHPSEARWILVDTKAQTLDVFHGDKHILGFKRVAIGSKGAAVNRRRGDNKTPIGRYRVTRLDSASKFRFFIGLDYPSRVQIEQAFRNKVISAAEYRRITNMRRDLGITPQDTILGGHIGIHGLGSGNLAIHEAYNWTQGCVALTNTQIDQLRKYVEIDMLVVII